MDTEIDQLHVLFFPLMAQGHILPTLDMVRLFAARGVKTTIVTTPHNAPLFTKTIESTQNSPSKITLEFIKFPAKEVGLPEGLENLDSVTNQELHRKFFDALSLLQQPLEDLIQELRPRALVADMFFPWATDTASKFGIPRLVFHGTSFVSMCAMESIKQHEPHKSVSSDTEPFVLPGLPDQIKLTRMQLADHLRLGMENTLTRLLGRAGEAEKRSFGMIVNSFYELEPRYVDHYRKVIGRKAWHIGPLSLCNKNAEDKAQRGGNVNAPSIDEHECLKWLASKKPNSVVYICFGTVSKFPPSQLQEIALALEASEQQFIWVVRKDKNDHGQEKNNEEWLPEGYEKRMEGKGLIIRGWAPQVLILDHEAVGGFVTHCGWNSALEGISAGLPMVTWPVFAEQFYNEKLITDVLKIGVGVGVQQWVRLVGDRIKREAIEKAVKEITVGERAEEMRSRAKVFGEMARRAVEEGGSSYSDLGALIEELRSYRSLSKQD
ncbi:scopoletin glucosyltransferase-like [Alnus glutinosa]|uniref:scopoletin glucosyltransferase-like n=1 Tax=Alnus glutinosa TaxID=3517 RepID=UPI002D7A3E93|nr:scopoletin glucosyltransferase-like [Alnus glutinosa]